MISLIPKIAQDIQHRLKSPALNTTESRVALALAQNVRFPPSLANASSALLESTTASLTPAGRRVVSGRGALALRDAGLSLVSVSLSTTARVRARIERAFRCITFPRV
jgi:hypothetical protein